MNFLKGLLILCLLVLQACHYKNLKEEGDDNRTGLGIAPIDFAFVMKEVIQPRCLECHAPGGSASFLPLQTYLQVSALGADIQATIADDSMPKNRAPLTANQKEILNSWINAGMPETISAIPVPTPTPTPTPSPADPDPLPPEPALDWLTVKTLVIDQSCMDCHAAPKNRGGVNLETYQNTFSHLSLVDEQIRSGSMPIGRNPTTGEKNKITDEQKKLILDWIRVGAPEFAVAP